MSTRPGNHVKKKPGQKHQNTHAFKFDKYKTDPKAKMLKNLQVGVRLMKRMKILMCPSYCRLRTAALNAQK